MDVIPFLEIKFTTGDVIAIVVAIIAFGGTIYTRGTTKKISKSNEQQQYELNQKNIDVNLIANARIECIQNVRKTTSELLALLFEVLNTTDKNYLLEPVLKAQEKMELLIYYILDPKIQKRKLRILVYLMQMITINKNVLIVEFLSSLSIKLYKFYKKAIYK